MTRKHQEKNNDEESWEDYYDLFNQSAYPQQNPKNHFLGIFVMLYSSMVVEDKEHKWKMWFDDSFTDYIHVHSFLF